MTRLLDYPIQEAPLESSRRKFIKRVIGASTAVPAAGGVAAAVQAQTPGVRAFDHVALPMQNVEAMVAFYRALGFTVNESAQICQVHFGNQMINFHRPVLWQSKTFTLRAPAAAPPCGDLCFVWEGSLDSLKSAIAKVGATIETGPVNRQGGRQTTGSSVYIRDPDRNLLEFIMYP
jgi:catechol 2,3-dioxygenase-like lactoylglutathione lyase family enzyme